VQTSDGSHPAALAELELLLDASVLVAALDTDDPHHEEAAALLDDETISLATLDLARYEVANVAVRAWRAAEAVPDLLGAVEGLAADEGVIAADSKLISRAAEIAESHCISVYDAAYVAAAEASERTLVSCDLRDLVSNRLALLPEAALKDRD
jgi:predicted nucleic acid-binding protein